MGMRFQGELHSSLVHGLAMVAIIWLCSPGCSAVVVSHTVGVAHSWGVQQQRQITCWMVCRLVAVASWVVGSPTSVEVESPVGSPLQP